MLAQDAGAEPEPERDPLAEWFQSHFATLDARGLLCAPVPGCSAEAGALPTLPRPSAPPRHGCAAAGAAACAAAEGTTVAGHLKPGPRVKPRRDYDLNRGCELKPRRRELLLNAARGSGAAALTGRLPPGLPDGRAGLPEAIQGPTVAPSGAGGMHVSFQQWMGGSTSKDRESLAGSGSGLGPCGAAEHGAVAKDSSGAAFAAERGAKVRDCDGRGDAGERGRGHLPEPDLPFNPDADPDAGWAPPPCSVQQRRAVTDWSESDDELGGGGGGGGVGGGGGSRGGGGGAEGAGADRAAGGKSVAGEAQQRQRVSSREIHVRDLSAPVQWVHLTSPSRGL